MLFGGVLACGLCGCHTADVSDSVQVHPDDDPLGGAINSQDVRTVASQMAPAILGVPEVANAEGVTPIAVADFKNSSRFISDRNLFMKRLRLELNRFGGGKVRFISQNANVQQVRTVVLEEQQEEIVREKLKQLARKSPPIRNFRLPARR